MKPIQDCCDKAPARITVEDTGDFEAILCHECHRIIYGDPADSETIGEWNSGKDDT